VVGHLNDLGVSSPFFMLWFCIMLELNLSHSSHFGYKFMGLISKYLSKNYCSQNEQEDFRSDEKIVNKISLF